LGSGRGGYLPSLCPVILALSLNATCIRLKVIELNVWRLKAAGLKVNY